MNGEKDYAILGIEFVKQDFELFEETTVCGIESESFRSFQENNKRKSK